MPHSACALFMLAGIDRFVGTGIDARTYSMDKNSVFSLLFGSLVWLGIFGLLLSLVLWDVIFLNYEGVTLEWDNLLWSGRRGFFLDLPAYLVVAVFLFFHRNTDLSRRVLTDPSCVFDDWW